MTSLIVFLNRLFRRPNVGGRESRAAYSKWEHELGRGLVRDYLEPRGDLAGKTVLDVGCGLGGKSVAYCEAGAKVVGVDILPENAQVSMDYAADVLGIETPAFLVSDAARLPFPDATFDAVVANDAMEHFSKPAEALGEMERVTRPGGVIWLFFTPHYSPLGSHLYDYIYAPWCHLLFTRRQLETAVHRVLSTRMDGASLDAVARETDRIMMSYDNDLNHMSVRWFFRIVGRFPGLRVSFKELRPPKFRALAPLTRVPLIRELFTGFVICRLEKVN